MSNDVDNNALSEMRIMTVVYEPNKTPRVDLGEVDPYMAASIFRLISDILEEYCFPAPEITYMGAKLIEVVDPKDV